MMLTINERLSALDVAARKVLRRYEIGEMRLTASPYVHACWAASFDGRMPRSMGVVVVDRQFIVVGRGHGDRSFRRRYRRKDGDRVDAWVEAARACCGVPKGNARYFIKHYPAEVFAIIRHLYPSNRKAVSLRSVC